MGKKSQIQREHESFQRRIEFFKQENAFLKYRISEMVDNDEGDGFLQTAEYFQGELLRKDEMINQLRNSFQRILDQYKDLGNVETLPSNFLLLQKNFRNDLYQFEKLFLSTSKEFNEKMLQSIDN